MAGCSSTRRRCRPSSPSSARTHPLEDDDLLHEIFLRLPPQPPHRLRASLVSKRWRRLATDPKFLRRFCIHHRKPPLLGGFSYQGGKFSFRSTLDPPYRIPPERFSLQPSGRFSLQPCGREIWTCLDCRHGRLLFDDWSQSRVIVWDPVTDNLRVVPYPQQFHDHRITKIHTGMVLCAAGDKGHVHGACHSSPFKVVVLSCYQDDDEATAKVAFASVYSSETGIWSHLISTTLPGTSIFFLSGRSTFIGNTLYCLLIMSLIDNTCILEFDLDAQRLDVIKRPPGAPCGANALIIQAEDGGLGFAALTTDNIYLPCLQMWDRQVDSHGVATCVLRKTLELHKILGLESWKANAFILNYLQDIQAIFLWVESSVYMLQLESMQSKELFKSDGLYRYHPFASFYAEGILE